MKRVMNLATARAIGRYAVMAVVLGCALLAVGCEDEPSEVIVLVDAERDVRKRASELQISVEGRASADARGEEKLDQRVDLDELDWPVRVALSPSGDDAKRLFRITARAFEGKRALAAASLSAGFVAGETRWVRLLLEDACIGLPELCDPADDLTCHAGACVSSEVDVRELGRSEDDAPSTRMLLPARDGGASAGSGGSSGRADGGRDDGGTVDRDAGSDGAVEPPPADAGACSEIPESCNDSDDDCDEKIDEGVSRPCGLGKGVCGLGTESCSAGSWGACLDESGAAVGEAGSEACEGTLDEDCDDGVDEGCPCLSGERRSCGSEVGACAAGSQLCTAGSLGACEGETSPVVETCDLAREDQDCDGRSDEGLGCARELSAFASLFDGAPPAYARGALNAIDVGSDGSIGAGGYVCSDSFMSETCDIWVGKLRSDLSVSWFKTFDSGYTMYQYFVPDFAAGVAVDSAGNVIAAGRVCNGGTETSCDVWVRKYGPDGNTVVFTSSLDIAGAGDEAVGIAVDGSDEIVVVANFTAAADDNEDIWLRKYAANGDVRWTRTFDGVPGYKLRDYATAVAVDREGSIIVTGVAAIDTGPTYAAWIRKYDGEGGVMWTRTYQPGGMVSAVPRGVATDRHDNVLVAGIAYTTPNGSAGWLRRYDFDGNPSSEVLALPITDGGRVAVDAADHVLVVGGLSVPNQRLDFWARRYDPALTEVWTRGYDRAGEVDTATFVATDAALNAYVSGQSSGGSAVRFLIHGWGP
jgi:hypothetical protein